MKCVFGASNSVACFSSSLSGGGKNVATTSVAPVKNGVFNVTMKHDLDSQLVTESAGVFSQLNEAMPSQSGRTRTFAGVDGSHSAEILMFASRQYRSALRSAICNRSPNDTKWAELKEAELIWTLCEILFMRPEDQALSADLADWAALNFTYCDQWAAEIANYVQNQSKRVDTHPKYWSTVYCLVLFGRLSDAVQLLSLHPLHTNAAFQSCRELLIKAPFSALDQVDEHSNNAWLVWQTECRRRWQDNHFMTNQELEIVARILAGDESVLRDLVVSRPELLNSWFEAAVPVALYCAPTVQLAELQDLVQIGLRIVNNREETSVGRIIAHLFELDLVRALKDLSETSRDWWLAAHLVDLLQKSGCDQLRDGYLNLSSTSASVVSEKSDLRTFIICEYAQTLMGDSSLWPFAVDYFISCGTRGRRLLELTLARVPLTNQRRALKLLAICDRHKLNDVKQSIYKQLVIDAMPHVNTALGWSLQSMDPSLMCHVAQFALHECNRKDLIASLRVLDHIHSNAAISSASMLLLIKYREYHSYRSDPMKQRQACGLLIEMLTSGAAPRYFWRVLFEELLEMLDTTVVKDKSILDSKGIYELMNCMEKYDCVRAVTDKRSVNQDQQTIDRLRYVLLHQLADS